MRYTILIAIIAGLGICSQSKADEWSYSVEPYLLAASIEGDAGIGRVQGAEVDVGFDTILDTIDIGAMVHFEAHNTNGWGFAIDYGFMDLSDDLFGPRDGVLAARVRQGTFEGLLIRQSGNAALDLEYFAGFRWWDNDVDVIIDPAVLPGTVTSKTDSSWIDLIFGVRWTHDINEKWQTQLRADVGGFGIESDFTSSVAIAAAYRFSERYSLDLQYKALWVDFEEGKSGQPGFFAYDTVTHGPIVGLKIEF
jgi:hypothetical protein